MLGAGVYLQSAFSLTVSVEARDHFDVELDNALHSHVSQHQNQASALAGAGRARSKHGGPSAQLHQTGGGDYED
jgi:hypothetical protein